MGALANYGFRIIAFATLTLGAAGCGTYGVDPASPGYKALNAGDYAKARDIFWTMYTQDPHDPFVELDLASAYQGLGRMDLAEPYYRRVLEDGEGIVPKTAASSKGKTLAVIACENLRTGLQDPDAC
jgi:tetratricopeptide (TPR) repeat protein